MPDQGGLYSDQETVVPDRSNKSRDQNGNEKDLEQGGTGDHMTKQHTVDPNIVDWDGPDDPANPLNWSGPKKVLHIAYVSLFVLYA